MNELAKAKLSAQRVPALRPQFSFRAGGWHVNIKYVSGEVCFSGGLGFCFDLHCPITAGRLSWALWAPAELTGVTDSTDSLWLWLIYDTITLRFSGLTSKISSPSVGPLTLLWHLLDDTLERWFLQMCLALYKMDGKCVTKLSFSTLRQENRRNSTCNNLFSC